MAPDLALCKMSPALGKLLSCLCIGFFCGVEACAGGSTFITLMQELEKVV